jgi:hypothetical protein
VMIVYPTGVGTLYTSLWNFGENISVLLRNGVCSTVVQISEMVFVLRNGVSSIKPNGVCTHNLV